MNSFNRANNHLTHVQIVSEYEDKVRTLERENERLIERNKVLRTKVENSRYFVYNHIQSLKNSLKKEPDRIKKGQLDICLDIQEELKWKKS